MPHQILNWMDIFEDFNETVLLGNGASISVNRSFRYGSLKDHAIDNGLLTRSVQRLFAYF